MHGIGKVYKVLVEKPKGKSPLQRPRHRWEDGIQMDLIVREFGGEEWTQCDYMELHPRRL
jgi:hypothetical protein